MNNAGRAGLAATATVALLVFASAASANPIESSLQRGDMRLSIDGGAVGQAQLLPGNLQLWNLGARLSYVPFEATAYGPLRGMLEMGAGPIYQRYRLQHQTLTGVEAVFRYRFTDLGERFSGRCVPYVEGRAGAGATDLDVPERIHYDFNFILQAGLGFEYVVSNGVAPYVALLFQHDSTAKLQEPNPGFNAGIVQFGVSFRISRSD